MFPNNLNSQTIDITETVQKFLEAFDNFLSDDKIHQIRVR